jgi:hypothetical protein
MTAPFLKIIQTQDDGWQAIFAFQVFHRSAEEWLKMRWGFNAGVLLEEAIDRHKLFVETQAASEIESRAGIQPNRVLALRGINLPKTGLQMGLIGKVSALTRKEAEQDALHYARDVYSTFPHDFLLTAAENTDEYKRLSGENLLSGNSSVAQIQRGIAFVPIAHGYHYLTGLWQTTSRSNEQIWRALSAVPSETLFNIIIQPSVFYDGERQALLEIKKHISKPDQNAELSAIYVPWAEKFIKRRLSAWKKFFLLQVHVLATGTLDGDLLRSIGSALTRDTNDLTLPGFQITRPDNIGEGRSWRGKIMSLEIIPSLSRFDDLADSEEASSVFRFPYLPEAGLPGANFIEFVENPYSPPNEQG